MQTRIRQEKGIAGADIMIGVVIIVLFTSLIVGGMYQAYQTAGTSNYSGIAINYAVQFLEYVDEASYEMITTENLNSIRDNSQIDPNFNLQFSVTNYQDTHPEAMDLVKTVTITIHYTLGERQEKIEINKIKVKE